MAAFDRVQGTTRFCAVRWAKTFWVVFLLLSALGAHAASYVYDSNGRLRAVTNSAGETSEYIYDALGNLYAVDRIAASQLSIFAFTPNRGVPGSTNVHIFGQGFSAVPNANSVEFNGTPVSSVVSATSTDIVVTVPSGATTGPISVQVGSAVATSLDNFQVTPDGDGLAPVIDSFSPAVAASGTPVTVLGSHFTATAGPTLAGVNLLTNAVVPTSDSQLTFLVPTRTGSGPVTVVTPYGSTQSINPLIVLPSGVSPANVLATANLAVDGPSQTLSIGTAGKYAAATFAGVAGQLLSMQVDQWSATPSSGSLNASVYDSTGTLVTTASVSTTGGLSVHLSALARNGTYLVLLTPSAGATAQFALRIESALALDASGHTVSLQPSQSRRGQFVASAPPLFGFLFPALITTPSGGGLSVKLYDSRNTQVGTWNATSNLWINLPLLTVGARYTAIAQATSNAAATAQWALMPAPTASLTANFSVGSVQTSYSGQYAYLIFPATQGENLGLGISNLLVTDTSTPNHSTYAYVTVYKPDGSTWASNGSCQGGACDVNLGNAPVTGTYTVIVRPQPYGTGTLSFDAMLSDDLVVPLPANTATAMGLSRNGQNGRYTFDATAGTTVGIQVGGIATTPVSQSVGLTVLKPDGTTLTTSSTATGTTFNLANLPATGNYTVFVDPGKGATANLTATYVTSGSTVVPVGGTATTISTTASGQYAYLNFVATQGENLGLGISNLVVTDTSTPNHSTYAYVTVYKPDGSTWASNASCQGGACDLNLGNAPVTGTYTVIVRTQPYGTGTLSFDATLSDDLVVPLPANTATAMGLSRNGQNGRYTFDATAGTTVGIQVGGIATTPASQSLALTVLKPDGTTLTTSSTVAGTTFNLANLPATGTYTVFVDPGKGATANLSATYVSSGSTVVPVGGTSTTISTTASGQYAYLNFAATQGENLGLGISNLVVTDTSTPSSSYAYIYVYKPDGTSWKSGSCQGNVCDLNLGNAPVTGAYSVTVQPYPYGTGTLSFNATLSDDLVLPLPANATTAMSLSRNGQNGRYTFDATAGTTVGIQVGGITTVPVSQTLALAVLKPDGTTLTTASTATGTTFNLASLPATGTYTVFVDPGKGATANLSATYVTSGSTVVPIGGTSTAISTTASGQYAYLNFVATQGENLGLGISNLVVTDTSTPSSSYAFIYVYKPDGTVWTSGSCQGNGCDLNLGSAPVAGTYTVTVQPYPYGTGTLSFNATLSDDLVVPLPASMTTVMSLSRNGQNGRYTFDATAGTTVGIQVGGITTVPASQTLALTVLKPDGTTLTTSSTATGTAFNLANLPATGTYTLFVDPGKGAAANLSVTYVASGSVVLSVGGGSISFTPTANGAYAYLNFVATPGENLGLGISNLVVTDTSTPNHSTSAYVTVYKPDGSTWTNATCQSGSGCGLNLTNAPSAGIYAVTVRPYPYGTGTLSFNAALSDDLVVPLPASTATAMSLGRIGQNGRYTFDATAGTNVGVQIGSIATTPASQSLTLGVLKPDGTALSGSSVSTSTGYTFNLANLPTTGTYTIFVDPASGAMATLSATLTHL